MTSARHVAKAERPANSPRSRDKTSFGFGSDYPALNITRILDQYGRRYTVYCRKAVANIALCFFQL